QHTEKFNRTTTYGSISIHTFEHPQMGLRAQITTVMGVNSTPYPTGDMSHAILNPTELELLYLAIGEILGK
ncbi:hypothetical protein ACSTLK_23990, partial [Vibrio parahaemolyticus]